MNYEEALNKIHSLLTFGSRPGLDRIKQLLKAMGNPQDKLKFIHIAGTNGKGSVCELLSAVLTDAGYKTGLFISPYITDFRERIQINNHMISCETLIDAVENTFPIVEQLQKNDCIITEFEYVMALEFYIHAKEKCDVVVLETGLGGLLDCTNVIKPPLCSVITTIGLDHTAILGDTLEEIALQKCGIIKSGSFAVTSTQNASVENTIIKNASDKKVDVYKSNDVDIKIISQTIDNTKFQYNGELVTLNLLGTHQIENAKTALRALEVLNRNKNLNIDIKNIVNGFNKAVNPARFEVLCKNPLIILDGAHNPNGIEALKNALNYYTPNTEKICIMGMLKDKDSTASIKLLENEFEEVITVPINNLRSLSQNQLMDKCNKHFNKVTCESTVEKAFDKAFKIAQDKNYALIICGSLYLAGEIRPYIINKVKNI